MKGSREGGRDGREETAILPVITTRTDVAHIGDVGATLPGFAFGSTVGFRLTQSMRDLFVMVLIFQIGKFRLT